MPEIELLLPLVECPIVTLAEERPVTRESIPERTGDTA